MNTTGNSDPGLSGVISPFTKMESLYFDNSDEPDGLAYELVKDLEQIWDEHGKPYVKLEFDNKDDYYNTIMSLDKYSNDNITISGTSRKGQYEIIVENDDTDDTAEQAEEEN